MASDFVVVHCNSPIYTSDACPGPYEITYFIFMVFKMLQEKNNFVSIIVI